MLIFEIIIFQTIYRENRATFNVKKNNPSQIQYEIKRLIAEEILTTLE